MKKTHMIYLAGDMRSGWQDAFAAMLPPQICVKDPSKHGLKVPAEYTKWDLDAVRDSQLVVAYMGPHNPSGYGMALEIGYAHALGRPIIFVDCMGTDWRSEYFGMVRSVASEIVGSFEEAATSALALLGLAE